MLAILASFLCIYYSYYQKYLLKCDYGLSVIVIVCVSVLLFLCLCLFDVVYQLVQRFGKAETFLTVRGGKLQSKEL